MSVMTDEQAVAELVQRHRHLYDGPTIDTKLEAIIRDGSHTKLSGWDILRVLRTSRSVFFDTHVEVVSGHHTATYLRFESVARFPELIRLLARDMAGWIRRTFETNPITGIVATTSAAEMLAEGIADVLHDTMRIRVTLTPFSCETGRI
jgi:orotate phosphoribosyltransferase